MEIYRCKLSDGYSACTTRESCGMYRYKHICRRDKQQCDTILSGITFLTSMNLHFICQTRYLTTNQTESTRLTCTLYAYFSYRFLFKISGTLHCCMHQLLVSQDRKLIELNLYMVIVICSISVVYARWLKV